MPEEGRAPGGTRSRSSDQSTFEVIDQAMHLEGTDPRRQELDKERATIVRLLRELYGTEEAQMRWQSGGNFHFRHSTGNRYVIDMPCRMGGRAVEGSGTPQRTINAQSNSRRAAGHGKWQAPTTESSVPKRGPPLRSGRAVLKTRNSLGPPAGEPLPRRPFADAEGRSNLSQRPPMTCSPSCPRL